MTCDSKINLNEIDNTIDVSKEAGYAYRIVMHLIQTSILDVILVAHSSFIPPLRTGLCGIKSLSNRLSLFP
jgi:hypothetical protein